MPETAKKAAAKTARGAVRGAADDLNAKRTAVADALYDYRTGADDVDLGPVWDHLARPFPQEDVERLPRNLQSGDRDKGRCQAGSHYCADTHPCGGWHARSIHLDYIGHAGITMRLNDVVGPANWTLEPMATTDDGLPLMRGGEFWAVLTVLGVSKMEVATNYDSTQEALGDVLRRAASRFGVGTYLWSKSERSLALTRAEDNPPPTPQREAERPGQRDAGDEPPHVAVLRANLEALDQGNQQAIRSWWPNDLPPLERLSPDQATRVQAEVDRLADPWANQGQEAPQDPQNAR